MHMTTPWDIIVAIVASFLGSGGLWAFIASRANKKSANTRLLMGLAYDRIMSLSGKYISQGYITQDDYYSLYQHLITPYLEADDEDGTVKRVSAKIDALPIREEGATNEQQNL